jgi:hypothetical protein
MTRRELIEMWLRQSDVEAAAGVAVPLPTVVLIPGQRSRVWAMDDVAG